MKINSKVIKLTIIILTLSTAIALTLSFLLSRTETLMPSSKKEFNNVNDEANLPDHVPGTLNYPSSPRVVPTTPTFTDAQLKDAQARYIAFPESLTEIGSLTGIGGGNGPNPDINRYAPLNLDYSNGYELNREYRHPDDFTIPTEDFIKAKIENHKKQKATFYGGVIYQRADINGYAALLRPQVESDGESPAVGVTISWYVQPFLYVLFGPYETPIDDVIYTAGEITEFAHNNVSTDLPPNAANTLSGYQIP